MKKLFKSGKIYAGGFDRSGVPLCNTLGKAVFTYASGEIKAPFIMVSRGDGANSELRQITVGDAICSMGGEVLLIDEVTTAAASLLTKKYRADFTVSIDGEHIELLDSAGASISRIAEQKIEKIMDSGEYLQPSGTEGEFYCRRDAYLDYTSSLIEMSGRRKIHTKVAIGGVGQAVQKAARQIFSIIGKGLCVLNSPASEAMKESGADIGFYFERSGRVATIFDSSGRTVAPEDAYCLIAAKIAEKDPLGNTMKDITGRGIRLNILENGGIHFADLLAGPDALFTAVMLSIYLSDRDEPLHKIIENLSTTHPQ